MLLVGLIDVEDTVDVDVCAAGTVPVGFWDVVAASGNLAIPADDPAAASPGPDTLVVNLPLSIYTPLKCQCSGAVSIRPVVDGSLKTPRCQSSPLEDALTEIGATVRLRSSAPVL